MHIADQKDSHYMLRAIELARLGQGSVSPNPVRRGVASEIW
jgi:hypothetical protein